jgi:hypothetical protein
MNAELYDGIRARILAQVPEITHVRLYNNQFDRSNNDETERNDEQAFPYPCAFIEFDEIEFTTATGLLQSFSGIMRIYLGFESYKFEDTYILDLKQKLYKALQGYQVTTTKVYGRTMRRSERQDVDHNNVYVYIQEYAISGKDSSYSTEDSKVVKDPPTALELTATLDIDNEIIRTGDGT